MTKSYKKLTRKILTEYLYLDGGEFYWRVHQGRMGVGSKAGHLRANGTYVIRLFQKGYTPQRLKYFMDTGKWPKRARVKSAQEIASTLNAAKGEEGSVKQYDQRS